MRLLRPLRLPSLLRLALLMAATCAVPAAPAAGQAPDLPPPVSLTTQEDHQRTLRLLGIDSLRQGANGLDTTAANYANYDESKANPYPIRPDLLLTNDRRRVTTPELWWDVRRPELVAFFDREVYGRVPAETPAVAWEVTRTADSTIGGVAVVTKHLLGRVDNSAYPYVAVDIQATLTTPAGASGPVPVILQFGFIGFRPGGGPGPAPTGPTWQEQLVAKGWGYAVLNPASVQADNGAGLTQGIIGLVNRGQPRGVDDWGALRAWAWGASRLLDYFETDPAVDAARVGVQGHSRYGKAAAVAMAYDPRFAIGYISSSGAAGLKPHRRNYGEIVENVAGSGEYHWMAGNYVRYAGPLTWDDLPVDAHALLALIAPRPVFIGAGDRGDWWVDARGSFLAAVHAGPVYRLLGARGLETDAFPPIETALLDGDLAFRQHREGHTPGPNWPAFITFAARYLDAPSGTP